MYFLSCFFKAKENWGLEIGIKGSCGSGIAVYGGHEWSQRREELEREMKTWEKERVEEVWFLNLM